VHPESVTDESFDEPRHDGLVIVSTSKKWSVAIAAALALGSATMSVTNARAFGRFALWAVINELCIPNYTKTGNPFPCLSIEGDPKTSGVAIVPDLWSATQILAVPTIRVPGIESPAVFSADGPRWFEEAWSARRFVFRSLARVLPREDIGLAINSRLARTQDQLHIHVDCLRPEVRSALTLLEPQLSAEWSTTPVTLQGKRYFARLLDHSSLDGENPFRLVADGPGRGEPNLGRITIAVVPSTRSDSERAFILLAGHFSRSQPGSGHSEDILDHSCKIAGT
jgi:CDP-diacylglycerol pyrophosphatase